ncbi:MAG: hypothetical protein A2173_11775 [Planctomycetes bacterium RBG_13_44_8b]|nr:MAG: hypothetical protein A2173_11775 [Planctomycetes bacterium RBG_13_44_8b]
MRSFLDCIPCFVRQAIDSARLATDDEKIHKEVLRQVLTLIADLDMSQSPPAIAQQIHRLIRKIVGNDDPYRKLKQRYNQLAMKICDELRDIVKTSKDPFQTAVKLAIAGNIIDLGAKSSIKESEIESVIKDCLAVDFDNGLIEDFRDAINQAEQILYLADNAGEIAFDRLLLEQMPTEKITVAVKGLPVINDATMEDAEAVGLTKMVKVIDNGSDVPGTILESCSQVFREYFDNADLVIAKGQGNYETLSDVDKNIFFILKVKCSIVARDFGCEVGEMIVKKSNAFIEKDNT